VLNGIENWRNVTYKIEWFAEGVALEGDGKEICGNLPGGWVNAQPCPGKGGELVSRLSGENYKIGQWVRTLIVQCISILRSCQSHQSYGKNTSAWRNELTKTNLCCVFLLMGVTLWERYMTKALRPGT